MKKNIMLAAALAVASASLAQGQLTQPYTAPASLLTSGELPTLETSSPMATATDLAKPRRSYATALYYEHPEGTFFRGYDLSGPIDLRTKLVMPLGATVTFSSSVDGGEWRTGGYRMSGGKTFRMTPNYAGNFFAPVTVLGIDSFSIGTNNYFTALAKAGDEHYARLHEVLSWGVVGPDTIHPLYAADDHGVYYYQNVTYTNGCNWGFFQNHALYGSGTMSYNGTTYRTKAIYHVLGRTAGPLYVERIVTTGRSFNAGGPLKNNAKLTAYITGVTHEADGSVRPNGEDVLFTLTAESGDTLGFANGKETLVNGSTPVTSYQGKLLFSQKKVDEFGNLVGEPFIIPANKEIAVYIEGFDNDNVDYSIDGFRLPDEEQSTERGYIVVTDGTQELETANRDRLCPQIGLVGMYDGVIAPEQVYRFYFENRTLKYNVVRVSADGMTNLTDGASGDAMNDTGDGFPGIVLATTLNYFNEDGSSDNYVLDWQPSWITSMQVTPIDDISPMYCIAFQCEPLPAGETGRSAILHFTGRGVTSDPIYVLQGDATLATAIHAAETAKPKADSPAYNLAGQRVDASYKGIVIQNGKKALRK